MFDRRIAIVVLSILLCRYGRADDAPPPYTRPPTPTVALPDKPGDHKLKYKTNVAGKTVEMAYLLHLPADYSDAKKKPPLLVFFHGAGECGTDLGGVYYLGPMSQIRADGGNPVFAATCPFAVLCPQCPPRGQKWNDDFMYRAAVELVELVVKNSHVDPDRVYATGLSMGGLGTWCVAEEDPDRFAAIAPVSSMVWNAETVAAKLRYVAVNAFAGQNDEPRFVQGTQQMEQALAHCPMQDRFTYVADAGHEVFVPAYASPQFYEWFLSHRRPTKEQQKLLDAQTGEPPFPTTPGHYLLNFETKIGNQPVHLEYVLYLPKTYKPGLKNPAVLFLHEQDTIGPIFKDICMHGPDLELERKPGIQNNYPYVVISPRLPMRLAWDSPGITDAMKELLAHVDELAGLDPARITVTGLNKGADGAWKLASELPDKFAAVVPVYTTGSFAAAGDPQTVVKSMAGRIYCKPSDKASIDVSTKLAATSKLGWQSVRIPDKATPVAETPVYGERSFLDWLAKQKRK